MQDRTCVNCGNKLTGGRFCPACGAPADATQPLAGTVKMATTDVRAHLMESPVVGAPVRNAPAADAPVTNAPARQLPDDGTRVNLTMADGTVFEMTGREAYLGRVVTNDIPIDQPGISRQHARIIASDGQVVLEDLGSTNGTFLNGERVTAPVPLRDGDTLKLGQTTLRVGVRRPSAASHETMIGMPAQATAQTAAPVTEPIISIRNMVKSYRSGESIVTILKNVSLEIGKGQFVALIGPSGCGKTTTLNMIIGIDRPDSGEIYVGDQAVHSLSENQMARWRGRTVGVVFQFFQLLPTLTVVENVIMPMNFTGTFPKRERRARAMDLLKMVGIDERANRLPSALSGGQQQRVAIARALACDPSILVADEPTGNLDSKTSQQVFSMLTDLNAQGMTIVMVTHDPVLARSIPRRIEMLDGEIVG